MAYHPVMTDFPGAATLYINLDAVAHNWRQIRDLHVNKQATAVVKANGYGLDSVKVAMRLYKDGCRTFFTALPGEAIRLRDAFDAAEITDVVLPVFGGVLPGDEAAFTDHNILPILNDEGQVARWKQHAAAMGRPLAAGLQCDSGMTRLGIDHDAAAILVDDPQGFDGIDLQFLMSHLCCADTPDHDMNQYQLQQFSKTADLFPNLPKSLSATTGSLLGSDYHFDFLRPGIGLYGSTGNLGGCEQHGLKPVIRLVGRIAQVRHITAGTRVGYGATWTAARDSIIATVGIGYADGYLRSLSNNGQALLNGVSVPMAGRVSMDLLTFDVTDAAAAGPVQQGDEIDLLGGPIDLDLQADQAGTISYELLTGLGARYNRRYTTI